MTEESRPSQRWCRLRFQFWLRLSYAEMKEKLKQIPSVADAGVPSALMFETVETLVSGLRGMALQRNLLSDLLETAEYTKSFVSQRKNDEEKLRLRVEQAEASSSTAREENKVLREENEVLREKNEVLREEVAEVKSREDSMEVRLFEAEEEMALLRREVRHLRTEVSIERRQREELQLRLSTQKEELEGEFAAERGELEAEYQKQVDEMYLFGYRCCMKKHGIKRDVPSIPPGELEKLHSKPAQ
ncbi:cingulin-like [Vitis riparia]|uniref:cingulin-like n=1 Tax=Vitis riparia TaxID=96939 RepID=UPI00155ACF41|nr:cingulin-like [Vitis riparia]